MADPIPPITPSNGYIADRTALFNDEVALKCKERDDKMLELADDASNPILLAEYQVALSEATAVEGVQTSTTAKLTENTMTIIQTLSR